MQRFDNLFYLISQDLGLSGSLDPSRINFDCLKGSVAYVEQKCGKLSEYSYQYIRMLAENCAKEGGRADSLTKVI
jgi:hypothetical protein